MARRAVGGRGFPERCNPTDRKLFTNIVNRGLGIRSVRYNMLRRSTTTTTTAVARVVLTRPTVHTHTRTHRSESRPPRVIPDVCARQNQSDYAADWLPRAERAPDVVGLNLLPPTDAKTMSVLRLISAPTRWRSARPAEKPTLSLYNNRRAIIFSFFSLGTSKNNLGTLPETW